MRVALGLVATLVLMSGCGTGASSAQFDGPRWRRGDLSPSDKSWMASDLRSRHLLSGKSRKGVLAMLGKPDADRRYGAVETLKYGLGDDENHFEVVLTDGSFDHSLFTDY